MTTQVIDQLTCSHDWEEVYYGWECTHCELFYPDGCAPWGEPEDPPDEWLDWEEQRGWS